MGVVVILQNWLNLPSFGTLAFWNRLEYRNDNEHVNSSNNISTLCENLVASPVTPEFTRLECVYQGGESSMWVLSLAPVNPYWFWFYLSWQNPESHEMVVVIVVVHTHTHNRFTAGLEYVRVQWHLLGYMQVCTPCRQPRQHPTTQFFTGRVPFLTPNQQRQSTEGNTSSSSSYGKNRIICNCSSTRCQTLQASVASHWACG